MDWLALGGFLFGIVILSYALRSKTIALQPAQRGLLIGTRLALIASACWITLPGLDYGLGSKDILSFLFIFLSILLYGSMVISVYLRKTAGPLLFDVPRPRSRKVSGYITAALFALLIALTFLTTNISRDVVIEVFFTSASSSILRCLFSEKWNLERKELSRRTPSIVGQIFLRINGWARMRAIC